MKHCVACNEPLEDDAKFCSECRARQPEKSVKSMKTKTAEKSKSEKQKTNAVKNSGKRTTRKKKLDYQERRQTIYDMTSRDNCGECGCKNCMQFAMKAASLNNNTELGACPYIDNDEAVHLCNNVEWV